MKHITIAYRLKLSVAMFALLCAVDAESASVVCPTDLSQTTAGINWSNTLTVGLTGKGILATQDATSVMECGKDGGGNVLPCKNNEMGEITKNCILAGYDPPPLLRPNVNINENFGVGSWSPFALSATLGTGVSLAASEVLTLGGSCSGSFSYKNGTVVSNESAGTNSPFNCPTQAKKNMPSNPVSPKPPTKCYDTITGAVIPCKTPEKSCDGPAPLPDECNNQDLPPPGQTFPPMCNNPAVNQVTGCATPGGDALPYCFNNLKAIPLYCSGSPACSAGVPAVGAYMVPGMKCGGAIPLMATMDFKSDISAALSPACPPDDWCLKSPTQLRDGYIHLRMGSAAYPVPAGAYNATIYMDNAFQVTGSAMRPLSIPPMGACKQKLGISNGSMALSEGYAYLVVPASIAVGPPLPTGTPAPATTPCYGDACNYSAAPSTWMAAGWPVSYTSPYQPYASISSPKVETYVEDPSETPVPTATAEPIQIPFIDLPSSAELRLSLNVKGSVTLPLGGNIKTDSGGIIIVPAGGTVSSAGNGYTLDLSIGTQYLLDGDTPTIMPTVAPPADNESGMFVADTTPCYVQVIPPTEGISQTKCATTLPSSSPVPAKNPYVAIKTFRLLVDENTALPITTERKNLCDPTNPAVAEGSTVEPLICVPPMAFSSATTSCVQPVASCDCTAPGITPGTCGMQFNTLSASTGAIVSTGGVSTALSPADLATYNAMVAANNPLADAFLATHLLPNVQIAGCTADVSGVTTTMPITCSPAGFTFSTTVGACTESAGNAMSSFLPAPGTTDIPAAASASVPPVTPSATTDPGSDPDNAANPIMPNPPYNPDLR